MSAHDPSSREEIVRLRAEDPKRWTYRALAAHAGVSETSVFRWCNEGYATRSRRASLAWKARNRAANDARDRAWRRTNRGVCSECGGPLGVNSGGRIGTCITCIRNARDARWSSIREMWKDGGTLAEIAAKLDTTAGAIGVAQAEMRAAGWDLPYRREGARRAA